MPIRLLTKNGKPYAYQWGGHGAIYQISKYGKKRAYALAQLQSRAAHAHGYTDRVSQNLELYGAGSVYDMYPVGHVMDKPKGAPEEYKKMWKQKNGK